jgi:hypothetical protein
MEKAGRRFPSLALLRALSFSLSPSPHRALVSAQRRVDSNWHKVLGQPTLKALCNPAQGCPIPARRDGATLGWHPTIQPNPARVPQRLQFISLVPGLCPGTRCRRGSASNTGELGDENVDGRRSLPRTAIPGRAWDREANWVRRRIGTLASSATDRATPGQRRRNRETSAVRFSLLSATPGSADRIAPAAPARARCGTSIRRRLPVPGGSPVR